MALCFLVKHYEDQGFLYNKKEKKLVLGIYFIFKLNLYN